LKGQTIQESSEGPRSSRPQASPRGEGLGLPAGPTAVWLQWADRRSSGPGEETNCLSLCFRVSGFRLPVFLLPLAVDPLQERAQLPGCLEALGGELLLLEWFCIGHQEQVSVHLSPQVMWTGLPCDNFHLLICCAILDSEKKKIMEENYGFNEILKVSWRHVS